MTMSWSRGSSTSTFLRLCSRAPRMTILLELMVTSRSRRRRSSLSAPHLSVAGTDGCSFDSTGPGPPAPERISPASSRAGEGARHPEGGAEARVADAVGPGDVVGHAVIGRGPRDGQPEGEVHRLVEVEELD